MLVREVQNNNYNSFTFGAKMPKGKFKTDSSFFTVRGEMSRQLTSIVSAFNDMFGSLKRLELQKTDDDAQRVLLELSEKFGIKKIHETVGDGIVFAKGQKDLRVSTHGVDSVRLCDIDSKTGEVKESLFIQGKKYVKTDTRDTIYKPLQYWRNDEFNVSKFENELQGRFDEVDFDILKVRREMAEPKINKIIQQVTGTEIQAQVNKATIAKPIIVEVEQPKPKKKLLSAYEKLLLQRAEQSVKKEPKVVPLSKSDVVSNGAKSDVVKQESVVQPVVKKRGRPKKVQPVEQKLEVLKIKDVKPLKTNFVTEPLVSLEKVVKHSGRVNPKEFAGFLSQEQKVKVDELFAAFNELNKRIANVPSRPTATRIKRDYPNLEIAHTGRNNLILTHVSDEYPKVEMNVFKWEGHKEDFLVLFAHKNDGFINKIAINLEDGSVLKKLSNKLTHEKSEVGRKGVGVSEYFTQEELKNFDTKDLIEPMTFAIKKFSDYVVERVALINDNKRFVRVGKVKGESAEVVTDIASLFGEIRGKLETITNTVTRSKVKYQNGMVLKGENPNSSFRGFRFVGGGADAIETTVNVRAYGVSGDILSVKTQKKDGTQEESFINITRGTVLFDEPKYKSTAEAPRKKNINLMSQEEVDSKNFAIVLSPLKNLMGEYLKSISLLVDDFHAGKLVLKKENKVKTFDKTTAIVEDNNKSVVNLPKKRGRKPKVKAESAPKVNVQAEVAQFLMNGLREIGENLKSLQKQLNKMQKDVAKLLENSNQ